MKTPSPSFLSDKASLTYLISLIVIFFIGILIPRLMGFLPGILGLGFFLFALRPQWNSQKQFLKEIPKPEIIIFGLIFLLALASSLWAPNPEFAVVKSFKLLGYFVTGVLLIHVARYVTWRNTGLILKLFTSLYVVALVFLISEKLSDHQLINYVTGRHVPVWKLNRSFVVMVMFSIPTIFFVTRLEMNRIKKYIMLAVLAIATLYAFSLTESQTAQLSFLVGLFFLFAFPIKKKIFTKILLYSIIIFALVFPFTINTIKNSFTEDQLRNGNYFVKQASIIYRFDVWNYAAEKTIKSPIYGNGISSLRFMKADHYMQFQGAWNILHGHNSVIQIWAEFGIIGISLGIALLLYIFRAINRIEDHNIRRLYLASFMAAFCCSLTGFGVWQSWQMGMFLALAAFAIAVGKAKEKKIAKT